MMNPSSPLAISLYTTTSHFRFRSRGTQQLVGGACHDRLGSLDGLDYLVVVSGHFGMLLGDMQPPFVSEADRDALYGASHIHRATQSYRASQHTGCPAAAVVAEPRSLGTGADGAPQ